MLENIKSPEDIKKLNIENLKDLCGEIRKAMMYRLSHVGGHVGGNLGICEATVAMHYVFNSPKDKFIFDVSHQCYTHKILTGRKDGFINKDKIPLISGFTKPLESEHDHFFVGHTSTSVSLALGVCKGRDLLGENYNVIALIGDGSLSGGEALEGLDYAGEYNKNLIIVVNDNGMSIAENHGGIYKNLKNLRENKGKCENNIFTALGLDYIFVDDGNDVEKMIDVFKKVKDVNKPVVIHIVTEKGKGYQPAEINKEQWHWHPPFNQESGEIINKADKTYVDVARDYLIDKIKNDKRVSVLCAGTPGAIGFTPEIRKIAGEKFIDVGIAEETAVAMASGMAKQGAKPIFCVQSSFIQRCYDQLSQDVCLNKSPIVIFIYSSGLPALRDATHLGIFDMAMMESIPNLTCLSPVDEDEFIAMSNWAIAQNSGAVVIRVPFGKPLSYGAFNKYNGENSSVFYKKGKDVAIFALGNNFNLGIKIFEKLKEKGIDASLLNGRCSNKESDEIIDEIKKNHKVVITVEDGVLSGGYGEMIGRKFNGSDVKILNYGLKREFIDRFDLEKTLLKNRLNEEIIVEDILKIL